jgi:hypothetical protein
VSNTSDDDTDSSEEAANESDFGELEPDAEVRKDDDMGALDDVDLDDDVYTEYDWYVEVEEYEQQKDQKEKDKDEDDGKEPWTIGQGEMVNILPDDVDTVVDN